MKTAVEYLEEIIYGDKEFSLSEVFEQAKEIERVQIIQSFQYGDSLGYYDLSDAEQYYNETFKNK
jgi:hypothetical protein